MMQQRSFAELNLWQRISAIYARPVRARMHSLAAAALAKDFPSRRDMVM